VRPKVLAIKVSDCHLVPVISRTKVAGDVSPDPETPTTATVRHSGTSTSMSRRLLCRAPARR